MMVVIFENEQVTRQIQNLTMCGIGQTSHAGVRDWGVWTTSDSCVEKETGHQQTDTHALELAEG